MKPVLYEANETQFDNMGLGQLNPISCMVVEERNGMYELEMKYGINEYRATDLIEGRIILAKPNDTDQPQPFQIYRVSKTINNAFTVNAEHISYRLSDIPVMPFKAASAPAAMTAMQGAMAENCIFTFGTDVTRSGNVNMATPTSARKALMGEEGSILDKYHGEYKFDRFNVFLHDARGQDNGLKIVYRRNLTSLEQERSLEEVITGVCPFWSNGDTVVTLPEKVLHASTFSKYPYAKTAVLDLTNYIDGEPTIEELRSQAQKYIKVNKIGYPKISITVKFVPLWQTDEYKNIAPLEHVSLCDWVTVYLEALDINEKVKVSRTEYNVLTERYNEVTLGTVLYGFSSAILSTILGTKIKPDDGVDRDHDGDAEDDWDEPVDDYDDGWDPNNNWVDPFDGILFDDLGNRYVMKVEDGDVVPIRIPERIIFTKMPVVDYMYDETVDYTPCQIKAVYSSTDMVEITEDCTFNPAQDTPVSDLTAEVGKFPMEAQWIHPESQRVYKCTTTAWVTMAAASDMFVRFTDVRISLAGYIQELEKRGSQASADISIFEATASHVPGGLNQAAYYTAKYGRAPLSSTHFCSLYVTDEIPYYVYWWKSGPEPQLKDTMGRNVAIFRNDIALLNKKQEVLVGYHYYNMDSPSGECTIQHRDLQQCVFDATGTYAPLGNARLDQ